MLRYRRFLLWRRRGAGENTDIDFREIRENIAALREDCRRDRLVSRLESIDFLISAPFSQPIDEIKEKNKRREGREERKKGGGRGEIRKKNERRQESGSVAD